MRRLAVTVLIPCLAILALIVPADAAVKWCKSDPIVALDGTHVQILVAIPEDYQSLVNGPIAVEVGTPSSVERELILTDAGFNGYGEVVHFTDLFSLSSIIQINNTFTTRIRVQVPIDRSSLAETDVIPTEVTIIPDNAPAVVVSGTTDRTTAQLSIKGR